jgi:hypothetical protein
MAAQSAPFLDSLPPYLDGRSVQLQNMVCCELATFRPYSDSNCCSGMYAHVLLMQRQADSELANRYTTL